MSVVDGKPPPVGAVPPPVAGGATGKFARSVVPVVDGKPPSVGAVPPLVGVVPVSVVDGKPPPVAVPLVSVGKFAIISVGETPVLSGAGVDETKSPLAS